MVIKKKFNELTNKEIWQIATLRVNVFSIEQNIKEPDLEELDYEAFHYFIKDNDVIVAYARTINVNNEIKLGRVCTNVNYRNRGLQKKIIKKILNENKEVFVSSQLEVMEFYLKFNFKQVGDVYYEAGIKHIKMIYKEN